MQVIRTTTALLNRQTMGRYSYDAPCVPALVIDGVAWPSRFWIIEPNLVYMAHLNEGYASSFR